MIHIEWITGKCIEKHDTRNHIFALQQSHVHYDMRKFNLFNRIIPVWNSLQDYVVASPTINTIKARLDKFWEDQWSNCGGTRGNGVPLPFLVGERRSPSLHDRCGWKRGNVSADDTKARARSAEQWSSSDDLSCIWKLL